PGRLRLRPARAAPPLPAGGPAALVLVLARRRLAPSQPVAQRRRPAPHGRALLAPRLQAAVAAAAARRRHPPPRRPPRRRLAPLDVVGWDGTVYPWAFPILAFQPRVSSVHLPPTWHGTFAARGALICSFVPRPLDFHPEAIPCPYPHSSTHCDEILFYCDGNFTSRRGV